MLFYGDRRAVVREPWDRGDVCVPSWFHESESARNEVEHGRFGVEKANCSDWGHANSCFWLAWSLLASVLARERHFRVKVVQSAQSQQQGDGHLIWIELSLHYRIEPQLHFNAVLDCIASCFVVRFPCCSTEQTLAPTKRPAK